MSQKQNIKGQFIKFIKKEGYPKNVKRKLNF